MNASDTPICPIPGLGHCVGDRCNFWDPQRGCIGVGLCFDTEASQAAEAQEMAVDQIILTAYEDFD